MKFDWKGYFEPTPAKAKKLGLAFKAIAATTVPATLLSYHTIAVALFFIGVAGEFLCNFFVEDKDAPNG